MTSIKTDKGVIKIQTKIPEEKTEGVVGPIPLDYTAEEIAMLLTENRHQNLKVSEITRLSTKSGKRSKAIRLVFYCKTLPTSVQIGTQSFRVEPYRRQVKRCTRCQKLDHDKRECTSTRGPRCPKCLEAAHPQGAFECKLERSMWRCINCNKRGHSSAYGGCPEILLRKKALELQAREYMPFATAMARAKKEILLKSSAGKMSDFQASQRPRRPFTASSPTRQLNYVAAVKVNAPDVSVIEKTVHLPHPFGYRRRLQGPQNKREVNPKTAAASQSAAAVSRSPTTVDQPSTESPPDANQGQEEMNTMPAHNSGGSQTGGENKKEHEVNLLDKIKSMMDTHTAIIESKIKHQCEALNCKIEKISNDVLKLTAERQQQLDLARQVILKGVEVCKDPVTKCAFDILECFRQAAHGNSEAMMNFALKITLIHLQTSQMTPPQTPKELLVALQNIVQPVE